MTPYAQLPKNNPEEFMRTVGLSKEDFQHLNDKLSVYIDTQKSLNPLKAGTERLQDCLGRPLVADTLLPSPLSDPDKSGSGLRH
jgi:hypothetical protein